MRRFYTYTLFIGFLIVAGYACTCKRNTAPNGPKVNVPVERFENDLFSINLDSVAARVPWLKAKYGEFFEMYNYKVIQLGSSNDPKYAGNLKQFITDYYMNLDYQRVKKVFPNVSDISEGLGKAFSNFRYYFPKLRIPRVYTCISGWNQSIVTSDTILGICLDKYLGRNCDLYEKLQLDKYMTYTMQRDYILPDCMRSWGYTEFDMKDSSSNVLTNMLYEAKIMYFVKQMLPDKNDTLIFGFSPAQLKWCIDNQKQMWTFLVENKVLFSDDNLLVHKLLFPAPYTVLFSKESPGRACVYLGYKIIASYMKANSNVTLAQLMKETDYNKVLRKSDFRP